MRLGLVEKKFCAIAPKTTHFSGDVFYSTRSPNLGGRCVKKLKNVCKKMEIVVLNVALLVSIIPLLPFGCCDSSGPPSSLGRGKRH